MTTGILVGDEARFVRSKLYHNQTNTKAGIIKESDLELSNTALCSLATFAQT